MRDAYGGTLMIWLMMLFIVLFVSFTAVIVNVAKTFRIKNGVINIVEQYDYANNQSEAEVVMEEYLKNSGYNINSMTPFNSCVTSDNMSRWYSRGVCISNGDGKNDLSNAEYYKVTLYVNISLPFFDINLTLPVSGETKSIERLS